MESDNPKWQPYDPSAPSPGSIPRLADGVRQVVLLADRETDQSGWAPRAALSVARTWVRRRERVLLADLGLMEPRLHEVVGGPNGEGISDVFLYGSSFQRVARRAGESLLFVPAGTAVADPRLVLESDRWTTIADGFERAGAILVLYLPDGIDGAESVLERASGVVVLSRGDGGVRADIGSTPLLAVLGPADREAGEPGGAARAGRSGAASLAGTGEGGATDRDRRGWETSADLPPEPSVPDRGAIAASGGGPASHETEPRDRQTPQETEGPAGRSASGPVGDPLASAASLDADGRAAAEAGEPPPAPSPRSRPPAKSGRRTLALLLILLLVVAGVVLAGLYGLLEVPGISPLGSTGAPGTAAHPGPADPHAGAA